jgi:LEA14-like dessication related protein
MRRRDFFMSSAAAGLTLGPASGCALLQDLFNAAFKRPSVRVLRMKILDMKLDTVRTQFDTEIRNPNPFGVSLAGLAYGFSIEGNRFASGDVRKRINVKANGRSRTNFPVDVALGRTANAILAMLEKNEVGYKLDSEWRFKIPQIRRPIAIPVNFGGRLPMPKIPQLNVTSLQFTNVSLSGLGVRVNTRVRNTNTFQLPIDGLDFDVKLNNRSVLRNKRVSGLRLDPGKTRSIPFDFEVGLVDLGLSAASIAQQPNLRWQVDAGVRSGVLNMPFSQNGTVRLRA